MARKAKRQDEAEVKLNRTMAGPTTTHDGHEIPAIKVPAAFAGFIDFVRTQGVVGLGVGFVVGTSANTLIKSIVTNLINPIVGLLTGGINLSEKTVCIDKVGAVCKNTLSYGQVISDFITFLVILIVVYFIIKGLKLDKLDKPKASK